jgi:hypothetical protein
MKKPSFADLCLYIYTSTKQQREQQRFEKAPLAVVIHRAVNQAISVFSNERAS